MTEKRRADFAPPRPRRFSQLILHTRIATLAPCLCLLAIPLLANEPENLPACAGCGRCCHWVVALRPGDRVPEAFVTEHDGVRCMDQRGDGACVALDAATLLCTIYEERPQTCRDFSRGSTLCHQVLANSAARRR